MLMTQIVYIPFIELMYQPVVRGNQIPIVDMKILKGDNENEVIESI